MGEECDALVTDVERREVPVDWWSQVLQTVTDGGRNLVVEDAAGNRFVVVPESRYRALEDAQRSVGPSRPGVTLTVREQQILQMISEGCPGSVVAQRLGLAPNTVAQHLAAVRRKYGVRSSAAAAAAARADSLIS
ncbi:MAG: helix-turn-helix domain-containing protein [Janthinobacterium lividum]